MGLAERRPIGEARTVIDERDRRLLDAIQDGLPLVERPYAAIGDEIDMSEQEVTARLSVLVASGVIKRFGVVVRHHELGYGANAMVVWDVPDAQATLLGRRFARFDFVTLCYRRARSLPAWRYNFYCMIHGQNRREVYGHIERLIRECRLQDMPHAVLFSRRRFKQCGARYGRAEIAPSAPQAQEGGKRNVD